LRLKYLFMDEKKIGLIEAILFYENDVINLDKLSKFSNIEKEEVEQIVEILKDKYDNDPSHGISINEVGGGYSICVKKEIYQDIKEIYGLKDKSKLSPSTLTVLSIIAYKQPITKLEIDNIRGVSSDNAVRILLEKNYIEITGRKDVLGRPLLYGTTQDFLKHYNLKDIKDLPQLNELKSDEFSLEDDDE